MTPVNMVPMMLSKLKDLFIVLIKHDTMRRHEPTDNNKILSFGIPTEIMKRSLKSIDFVYLPRLIIKYVQSVFSVI
jgi:hypothetical protein